MARNLPFQAIFVSFRPIFAQKQQKIMPFLNVISLP